MMTDTRPSKRRPASHVKCAFPGCQADLTKKGTTPRRCAGCHSIFYDDASCQKKDWAIHKNECKAQQRRLIAFAQLTHPHIDSMTKLVDCPKACGEVAACFRDGTNGFEENDGLSKFWVVRWAKSIAPGRARACVKMAQALLPVLIEAEAESAETEMRIRPVSFVKCAFPGCQADLTKKGTKRRPCAGCHSIFYDDPACQKKDWAIHKNECKAQQRRLISLAQLAYPHVDSMTKLVDSPMACGEIFRCYRDGNFGFEKNEGLSLFWMRMWAKSGDAEAQVALSLAFTDGKHFPRRQAAGERGLRQAAEDGDAHAQYTMGTFCAEAADDEEAVEWYRKAAEQGNVLAQFNLSLHLREGAGVAKDEVEAAKWCRKSAQQGDADAQCCLGICLLSGCGVALDEEEAVQWLHKSAAQGDASGQCVLAYCLVDGVGVPEDVVEAVRWYRLAAEQNQADGQYSMGQFYAIGEGVEENIVEAAKWFRLAAEQDVANAQLSYARCLRDGRGVEKDEAEARIWCEKAGEEWDDLGTDTWIDGPAECD